jgi:hypothetical protein
VAAPRHVLLFVGGEDTDAEWELVQRHLPALLGADAPREGPALVVERVPLDQASDVGALHSRTRGLVDLVWIVVLGESSDPDASVAQLEATGGAGLVPTATPSVLDLVLRHVVWPSGHPVLVYERALPPGGRADARLVQLAAALRALGAPCAVTRYEIDPGASAWERIFQRDAWLAAVARDVRAVLARSAADDAATRGAESPAGAAAGESAHPGPPPQATPRGEQPPAHDADWVSDAELERRIRILREDRERGQAESAEGAAGRGAAATAEAPARTVDENVQFTVYRPRRIAPARWHTLLAFAHLAERRRDAPADAPDPVAEVKRQAEQRLGEAAADYRETVQDSTQAIPREGEITFLPEVPGLTFNPPRRAFRWTEDVHCEEFRFAADPSLDQATVRGRLTVLLGTIIVADVPLVFEVRSLAGTSAAPPLEPSRARPYRNIFPSYSHQDVDIVHHCEHFAATLGDRYLRDTIALRAGERWSARLMDLIREADVFQLFWSTNSMRSSFVRQEWEFALDLQHRADKDAYFIRPTYWQEPLPADTANDLPPASLRQLHFQRLGSVRTATPPEPEDVVNPPRARSAPTAPPPERRPVEETGASSPGGVRKPPLAPPSPAWSLVVPVLVALFAGGLGLAWLLLRALR